ncbi:hypothetical protein LP419_39665 [Massilia sp. H-1]|nr:hypothetical protein LP419_39665 [Massilia sp. H-1]
MNVRSDATVSAKSLTLNANNSADANAETYALARRPAVRGRPQFCARQSGRHRQRQTGRRFRHHHQRGHPGSGHRHQCRQRQGPRRDRGRDRRGRHGDAGPYRHRCRDRRSGGRARRRKRPHQQRASSR